MNEAVTGPLAIICGAGTIPRTVAAAVTRQGRRVILFPVRGWAEPTEYQGDATYWISLGQLGRFARLARREGCREVVLIGNILRPRLADVRLDWASLLMLPYVIRAFRGGDNHLLSSLAAIGERFGFRVLGAHEVAPEILMPLGSFGSRRPSARDVVDIQRALALLAAMSPFDVGQAAVVADGHPLAIEAAEGTDLLLQRIADLRTAGRIKSPRGVGVLVKAPKRGQDTRLDLPAFGTRTVEGVARVGLAGIAVVAGGTIVADPQRVADAADAAEVFVIGVNADGSTA